MADTTAQARQEVADARRNVESELDDFGTAIRGAIDIPAKVRRNPVRTVGLATGAAFFFLGGPKRVARAAEKRLFPKGSSQVKTLLPNDVEASVNKLEPEERDRVRAHLERDFAAYLQRHHTQEPANARRSLWRTYDIFAGILGAAAARELLKRFIEVPKEVEVDKAQADAKKAEADTKETQAPAKR